MCGDPLPKFPNGDYYWEVGAIQINGQSCKPFINKPPPPIGRQAPASGHVSPRLQPILNKFSTPNICLPEKNTIGQAFFFCCREEPRILERPLDRVTLFAPGGGRLLIRYIQPLFNSMIGAYKESLNIPFCCWKNSAPN